MAPPPDYGAGIEKILDDDAIELEARQCPDGGRRCVDATDI